MLDLPHTAEPGEILEIGGRYRATDNFEDFARIERHEDGSFRCRFFLHGIRHVAPAAPEQLDRLKPEDPLCVTLELTNPATKLAGHLVIWCERWCTLHRVTRQEWCD